MSAAQFISIIFCCLLPGHGASILNRMLEYWQPSDVYVIWNSTTAGENVIATVTYPRFVSVTGDFSSFIPRNPILSVFPDNFVLVVLTDDTCRSVIPILRHQLAQRIIVKRSKVVIFARSFQQTAIEGLFRELWILGFLNVFLLDDRFIFGFNPFANDFCIRLFAADYHHLISGDPAANFNGTQIRVPRIDVYPGEQNITWRSKSIQVGEYFYVQQPFAEYFNASLRAYTPKVINFGFEFFYNATSSIVHPGVGEELVVGRGDLTLLSRVYATSNYFDFLQPLQFKECNLLIPKSGRVPQYRILGSVACSWIGIFILITLTAIVIFIVVMERVLCTGIDVQRFVFELSSVFIGQSFSFTIRTLSMRVTVFCWLVTCISLGTLFNAKIVTSFLTPMYVTDINNPYEAIQGDGFNVYTFDDFAYYLRGNSKELFPSEVMFRQLWKKLRGVSREEFFERLLHPNGRDMFMVIAMADNLIEKTKYLTEQTYSYHKTRPFFISLTANIVPRGSIIYNHYNDFNYRVFEAGLRQHWKTLELLYEIKFGSGNEAQEKSLTVEDLYSAFLVLILGYGVAIGVFIIEQSFAYFREKFVRLLN